MPRSIETNGAQQAAEAILAIAAVRDHAEHLPEKFRLFKANPVNTNDGEAQSPLLRRN